MAKIRIKYFGRLRELLGIREEEYDAYGITVADLLLKYVPERHRNKSKEWVETIFMTVRDEVAISKDGLPILKNYIVLVNGRNVELTYRLENGDEVAILPPVGGGYFEN